MKRLYILLAITLSLLGIYFAKCKAVSYHYSPVGDGDTVKIEHKDYTTWFIKSQHIPYLVKYILTADMLSCSDHVKRTNHFEADPELLESTDLNRDYSHSGYDRGHNMPAEDNRCSMDCMGECFYYTNIYPQTAMLNRGVWKELEIEERQFAQQDSAIVVYIGSVASDKKIGPDSVTIPAKCWKVIYWPAKHQYRAWIFPNTTDVTGVPDDFETDVKNIINISDCGYLVR